MEERSYFISYQICWSLNDHNRVLSIVEQTGIIKKLVATEKLRSRISLSLRPLITFRVYDTIIIRNKRNEKLKTHKTSRNNSSNQNNGSILFINAIINDFAPLRNT